LVKKGRDKNMSADQLQEIKKALAEIAREADEDQAVDDLKRAAEEANVRARQLKERSERVQRRLANAS
jgi:chaperonin cofactor prefoldin